MSRRISSRKKYIVRARDHQIVLHEHTKIMGIINITPDSFSGDGCLSEKNFIPKAVHLGMNFIEQGADILDIGGESTRPGAEKISVQEEISRIIPAIKELAKKTTVPISADTYKTPVAQEALDAGAGIINNVMGIKAPKSLLKMIKNYDAAIVLMHIKGTPRTMQKRIFYKDLIAEIILSLRKSIENCLEIGIKSDRIIIDPGIGFGKTVEHNLEILNRLKEFEKLSCPVLIGTSRKSFIGKVLGKDSNQRLMGTAATVCAGIMNGAHIVRVHDIKEIFETVRMTDAILNQKVS